MFEAVLERCGRLDVLVTTASIWETIPLEQVTAADLRRNFEANTLGTFLCARRAQRRMPPACPVDCYVARYGIGGYEPGA
jgi:NAD(P)-dependent dehydrogenase (short-subunit alcohol dehydrogenase family)